MNLLKTKGVAHEFEVPGYVPRKFRAPARHISLPGSTDIQETLIRRLAAIAMIAAFFVLILLLVSHYWIVLALTALVRSLSNPQVALAVGALYGILPLIVILVWTGRSNRKESLCPPDGDESA